MINVRYICSDGTEYNLQNDKVMIAEENFHKHSWKAETTRYSSRNIRNEFIKEPYVYDVVIRVRGNVEERTDFLNRFRESADLDLKNNVPGTVWVNNAYIKGFFISSESGPSSDRVYWSDIKLQLYCPESVWVTESTVRYLPNNTKIAIDQNYPKPIVIGETYRGKALSNNAVIKEFKFDFFRQSTKKVIYPMYDFKFDFAKEVGKSVVNNINSMSESDFIMTIYGFADNPIIYIGGHPYQVNATVYDGERIEIDSKRGTVEKIGRLGEVTNLYNARGKLFSVFKKVPAGANTVSWSGGFGFDLTLFDERSEPEWSL